MEWLILFFALPFYFTLSYLGYNELTRRTNWFIPVSVLINLILSIMWFFSVKYIDHKSRIFFYSLCWDSLMIATAYFVPILLFNLQLNKLTILGFFLMMVGLALIKIYIPE